MDKEYEQFGDEWKKEIMKHPKAVLVEMIKAIKKETWNKRVEQHEFKVGDEVWYIDKYAEQEKETCTCCNKITYKKKYIPKVKSKKIDTMLIDEIRTTYYSEYYIGYHGENDITEIDFENGEYFKTKEQAEQALKELEGKNE